MRASNTNRQKAGTESEREPGVSAGYIECVFLLSLLYFLAEIPNSIQRDMGRFPLFFFGLHCL